MSMQAEPSTVGVSFISASKTKQPSKRDQGFWCCWGTIPSVSVAKRVMQTVLRWQTCTLEEHRRPLGLLASKPASQPGKDGKKKKTVLTNQRRKKRKRSPQSGSGREVETRRRLFAAVQLFFVFFFFSCCSNKQGRRGHHPTGP